MKQSSWVSGNLPMYIYFTIFSGWSLEKMLLSPFQKRLADAKEVTQTILFPY